MTQLLDCGKEDDAADVDDIEVGRLARVVSLSLDGLNGNSKTSDDDVYEV